MLQIQTFAANKSLVFKWGKGRRFHRVLNLVSITLDDFSNIFIYSCLSGNWQLGANYLREQYTLIYMIATYRKPQVKSGYV